MTWDKTLWCSTRSVSPVVLILVFLVFHPSLFRIYIISHSFHPELIFTLNFTDFWIVWHNFIHLISFLPQSCHATDFRGWHLGVMDSKLKVETMNVSTVFPDRFKRVLQHSSFAYEHFVNFVSDRIIIHDTFINNLFMFPSVPSQEKFIPSHYTSLT